MSTQPERIAERIEDGTVADDRESEDSLVFSNGVIEKIVALSLRDVPGIVGMRGTILERVQDAFGVHDVRKGVTVEIAPDGAVRIEISIIMAYGVYAPDIFDDTKKAVMRDLARMTGLAMSSLHLRVEDVYTDEEVAAHRNGLPEPGDEDGESPAS